MKKLLNRLFPWQYRWKRVLAEALLFLTVYIVWLIIRSPESRSRFLIGNIAVLAPLVTAVIFAFMLLPKISLQSQQTWRFIGLALLCWAIGHSIRTLYEGLHGIPLSNSSLADDFNFLAYPFFFYALVLCPFENRYDAFSFPFPAGCDHYLRCCCNAGLVEPSSTRILHWLQGIGPAGLPDR